MYYPPKIENVPRQAGYRPGQSAYMVEYVDYLIVYTWHPTGNARDFVEYARKREIKGLITVTLLGEFDYLCLLNL